ncbi:MAG: hypothetical protein II996_00620 [Oscillospiraceae bacterium]|nr:hypothetical protein [Oscillospiraceae bacterium]MBQ4544058.1 hypothetical protein [Oscillospiraceae bacterium]MBQ6901638.1 hypothetical protein [Oscillospiraceae bacterium]
MDWKALALDDLRRYNYIKVGIINSTERLRAVEAAASSRLNSDGEKTSSDPLFINQIAEAERLKRNISSAKIVTTAVERGLSALLPHEKRIIENYYMSDYPKSISQLKDELGYSRRSIYRLRDTALEKFTLAMYGVENS